MNTEALDVAIRMARAQVGFLEKQVAVRGSDLASRLTTASETVEGNRRVLNSLGELQGNGVQFDIYCARLSDAREHLNILESLKDEVSK